MGNNCPCHNLSLCCGTATQTPAHIREVAGCASYGAMIHKLHAGDIVLFRNFNAVMLLLSRQCSSHRFSSPSGWCGTAPVLQHRLGPRRNHRKGPGPAPPPVSPGGTPRNLMSSPIQDFHCGENNVPCCGDDTKVAAYSRTVISLWRSHRIADGRCGKLRGARCTWTTPGGSRGIH